MTINTVQGQSIHHISLDLQEEVIMHGQLYVALSQATSSHHIKILLPPSTTDCCMKNVVYPEIFQLLELPILINQFTLLHHYVYYLAIIKNINS